MQNYLTCPIYILHITVYDWQSHDLPLKHAAKAVLLALRCRRPLVIPAMQLSYFMLTRNGNVLINLPMQSFQFRKIMNFLKRV